ncbi:MAG: tRNA 2-thiouridine(34) synthase MnmA [Bradymonadia bacterium]
MRVMVAMSGGVDSSVACGLMHEAGHEVIGLTMRLRDTTTFERGGQGGSCCSPDDIGDAAAVCDQLGVPHYVVDYRDAFKKAVIEPFAKSYLEGLTPNPCVLCNDHLKFSALLTRARALGADLLITGHYARSVEQGDRWTLRTAVDGSKDQSYFLFGIRQKALARTRFPLGDMTKDEVRAHAHRMGLAVADKADSEDICFVPDGDYAKVVEQTVGADAVPGAGPIVNTEGKVLGEHQGVHHFTVGQRKGLGVAAGTRLYVLEVDGPGRTIVVGGAEGLLAGGLTANRCNWISGLAPTSEVACTVKIRYRHPGVPAIVRPSEDGRGVVVRFQAPQRAVTGGQAAVFYNGDEVIGGGWIDQALAADQVLSAGEVTPRVSGS